MHVNALYTFRSVSRAIPMVSGNSDPNKDALHMNTFKVRNRRLSTSFSYNLAKHARKKINVDTRIYPPFSGG